MIISNKKSVISFLLVILLIASNLLAMNVQIAGAAAAVFQPTDDNWMWGTSRGDSTGSGTSMTVLGSSKRAFMKFAISGAGEVESAVLNLTSVKGGTATISVYGGSATNWTETTISYTNVPQPVALLDVKSDATFAAGTSHSFDVSDLITGDGTYTLILTGSANEIQFSTKEGTAAPAIVINGRSTPDPTAPVPIVEGGVVPFNARGKFVDPLSNWNHTFSHTGLTSAEGRWQGQGAKWSTMRAAQSSNQSQLM
ncbi:MAG: glycosyl hydrolase family protein [Paenibacillaceae bacterium]|nr:glycosyl hydrolase family protein [Paenibacillaceae bacterium]